MKKLTRILALTLCCLLAVGLTACGKKPAPTPDPSDETGGNTQIPNPMVAYEDAEFPDFSLTGYPDRDGMKPTGFCLIGGTIGEISYETATLRCAADTGEGEDLSGVYYPDAEESELSVGHSYCNGIITVTVKEHSEGTVALWKSCEGDFVYSLWLPGQTGDDAKALVREFAAGVYAVKPGVETPIGHVAGTEKDLARWREVIRAGNIAKVTAKDNSRLEPVELPAETAERMIKALADSESALKLFEKPENPATGGALNLTAYDAEGNVLFTATYTCNRLRVTFGQETANYIFDASDCDLDTLYTFLPVE